MTICPVHPYLVIQLLDIKKDRYTAVDYRKLFALKAEEIGKLRILSRDIDDSTEFSKTYITSQYS